MSEHKLRKNETAYYDDFGKLREAYGMKPFSKRTKDKEKLAKQQERFLGKCRICGQPLQYIEGTNVLVCVNPTCKGIKINEDFSVSVNKILDDEGTEIAQALFS